MNRSLLLIAAVLTVLGLGAALVMLGGDGDPGQAAPLRERAPDAAPGFQRPTGPGPEPRPEAARPSPTDRLVSDGRAPTRVTGRVSDVSGRPRSGVRVRALRGGRQGFAHLFETTPWETDTDGDGRFALDGLPAGTPLALDAIPADAAPARLVFGGLKEGEQRDVGSLTVGPGTTLIGRVVDQDDEPLAGATVEVVDALVEGADSGFAVTDADGRYELPYLSPRQYALRASAPGHASMESVQAFVLGSPGPTWTVDFRLLAADAALELVVVDPLDVPVADVLVQLLRRAVDSPAHFSLEGVTDRDGRLRFETLPSGQYDVGVRADRWFLPAMRSVRTDVGVEVVTVNPALEIRVTLDPPVERFDVTLRPDGRTGARALGDGGLSRSLDTSDDPGRFTWEGLTPGAYRFEVRAEGFAPTRSSEVIMGRSQVEGAELLIPLAQGGTLSGRVDPAAAGVRIELRDGGWDPASALEDTFPTVPLPGLGAVSGDDGRFTIDHVPDGRYVVTARAAGQPAAHLRDVTVKEGQPTDVGVLTLRAGGSLSGTVVGPDDRPRVGALVRLSGEGFHGTAVTDGDGRFEMTDVPAGDYDVSAAPGTLAEALRYVAEATVEVRAGARTDLSLRLSERPRDR